MSAPSKGIQHLGIGTRGVRSFLKIALDNIKGERPHVFPGLSVNTRKVLFLQDPTDLRQFAVVVLSLL